MSSEESKKWEKYKKSLPGLKDLVTEQPVEALDDDTVDYKNFMASLPGDVVSKMPVVSQKDYQKDLPKKIEHKWCLCDMPEGDFPRIHSYSDLSGLIDAIAKREGKETAVWAMYGVPLQLSKLQNRGNEEDKDVYRYLLLPENSAVIVARKEPFKLINQDDLPSDLEIEDQGWLGDPALLVPDKYFHDKSIATNQMSADPDMDDNDGETEEPV